MLTSKAQLIPYARTS